MKLIEVLRYTGTKDVDYHFPLNGYIVAYLGAAPLKHWAALGIEIEENQTTRFDEAMKGAEFIKETFINRFDDDAYVVDLYEVSDTLYAKLLLMFAK